MQLIRREENCGVSGWNDGLEVATRRLRAPARRRLLPAPGRPAPRGRSGAASTTPTSSPSRSRARRSPSTGSTSVPHRPARRSGAAPRWSGARCSSGSAATTPRSSSGPTRSSSCCASTTRASAPACAGDRGRAHEGGRADWRENVGRPGYRMNFKNIAVHGGQAPARARGARGDRGHSRRRTSATACAATPRAARRVPSSFGGFVRGLRTRAGVEGRSRACIGGHFVSFASPWWVSRPCTSSSLGHPGALVRRVLAQAREAARAAGQYYERALGTTRPPPPRSNSEYVLKVAAE